MLKKLSDFSLKIDRDAYKKSFLSAYQPYAIKKTSITELTYFLEVDISQPSGVTDFAAFINHAIRDGYFPVAGPIFRIPSEIESNKPKKAIIHVNVRKTTQSNGLFSKNNKLIYVATPSRLAKRKDEIISYVEKHCSSWLSPLHSLPYEYFEGGGASREDTMNFCCRLIDYCDELWVFGISDGTLTEVDYFLSKHRKLHKEGSLKILIKQFDPNWKEMLQKTGKYKQLVSKHKDTIKYLKSLLPSL